MVLLGLIQRYFEFAAKERGSEIGKRQQEQKGKGKADQDLLNFFPSIHSISFNQSFILVGSTDNSGAYLF